MILHSKIPLSFTFSTTTLIGKALQIKKENQKFTFLERFLVIFS